jgi:hypothetical protein
LPPEIANEGDGERGMGDGERNGPSGRLFLTPDFSQADRRGLGRMHLHGIKGTTSVVPRSKTGCGL